MFLCVVDLSLREHRFNHLVNKIIWFVIAVLLRVFEVEAHIASPLMPQLKWSGTFLKETAEYQECLV